MLQMPLPLAQRLGVREMASARDVRKDRCCRNSTMSLGFVAGLEVDSVACLEACLAVGWEVCWEVC